ncbi:autophagy-related protein 22 [Trichomonascus vanleenenianus]|uniref:Atg22p n=1 Tax=Trichomonascus vanleenenianus TaxID=2268995 RepID=UPI003ECA82A8
MEPTKQSELWGWYFYAWACEPFIVSAVGTYVPILLEQMARENGVKVDDHSIPCLSDRQVPGPPSPGFPGPEEPSKCVVNFFGAYIDTSSLALYTFSLSVLVQTLVVISMSGAADRGHFRKKLLIVFAIIGSIATALFWFVSAKRYYFASLLAVLSNAAFGAVSVCGNAYLPVLVNNHPDMLGMVDPEANYESEDSSLLIKDHETERARLSGKISGTGVAIGYLAALLVQIATMVVIKAGGSTLNSIKTAIFMVGVWWLVFQVPIAALLESRPGPPLPPHSQPKSGASKGRMVWSYVKFGWRTLFATFHEAREMKDVAIFLAAWFVVSDAATTINSAAVLFARTELDMSAPSLAIIGILVVFSGMTGAITIPRYIQPRLDRYFDSPSPVFGIIFVIVVASIIPLYGILGFFVQSIGLRHPWEMFLLAAWYGFALGGLNTLCRSVFSMLIPTGKETTFFALFAVTDKGSSIIGPAITGLITDKTHNIRYTFYFLFGMMILPIVILNFLDIDRGRREALALERVEPDEPDDPLEPSL